MEDPSTPGFDPGELSAGEAAVYLELLDRSGRDELDQAFAIHLETVVELRRRGWGEGRIRGEMLGLAHDQGVEVEAWRGDRNLLYAITKAMVRQALKATRPDRGPRPRDAD